MRRFRYEYGARPAHLVAVLLAAALAWFALTQVLRGFEPNSVLVYLGGAIIVHDLVLFPVYSLVGLALFVALRAPRAAEPADRRRLLALNHLRVPALLSALLFVVWFPLILGLSERRYFGASGRTTDAYMGRWLLITAGLFALSALVFAIRATRRAT